MLELSKQIKKKYKYFNVTPQWLGKVLRDNNKTSAISNKKCLGWILYVKGGSTKERFVDFLQNYIFQKYKNYLLVLFLFKSF